MTHDAVQSDQFQSELISERRGREGETLWVTLNRPEARNAITFGMYDRLADLCSEVNGDRSLRVMVIRGAGDQAFSAGTDISQFASFKTENDALAYESRIESVLGALEALR